MAAISIEHGEAQGFLKKSSLPILDLAYLRRQTLGNAALEVEMLELFLRQSTRLLSEFNAKTPVKEWRNYARALKGSSQSIGALQVAHLAAQIEDCSEARQSDETALLLDALGDAVRIVNGSISEHLKTNSAAAH